MRTSSKAKFKICSAANTSLHNYWAPSTPSHSPSSYSSAKVPSKPRSVIILTERRTSLSFHRLQCLACHVGAFVQPARLNLVVLADPQNHPHAPGATACALQPPGLARRRSPRTVKERTHEEATEALHAGREGRHPAAAFGGEGAELEALR